MFRKVLIVEDHESINISVQKTLEDLGITANPLNNVFYCDDALMRIQKACRENDPYELMITDLSFEDDRTPQKISSGSELIKAVRSIQPDIKVLVFSIENRLNVIRPLVDNLNIDAFVPKARQDAKDLKMAIQHIYSHKRYLSPNLKKPQQDKKGHDFTDYDKVIVRLLLQVEKQRDIPNHLEKMGIKPRGLSSVEKRLKQIKENLGLISNEQLILYCKETFII